MKSTTTLALFSALFVSFLPAAAKAQNRLSQIDFDEPAEAEATVAKAAAPIVDPEALVSQGLVQGPTASAAPLSRPANEGLPMHALARARMIASPVNVDSVQNPFITPRLKGPFADSARERSITTDAGWLRGKSSCADARQPEAVCSKTKALKEVLFKFSGSDDFFESQCSQSCGAGLVAAPSGLTVNSSKSGTFKIVSDRGQCRYQIEREPKGRWLALQANKITCACVPSSCVQ